MSAYPKTLLSHSLGSCGSKALGQAGGSGQGKERHYWEAPWCSLLSQTISLAFVTSQQEGRSAHTSESWPHGDAAGAGPVGRTPPAAQLLAAVHIPHHALRVSRGQASHHGHCALRGRRYRQWMIGFCMVSIPPRAQRHSSSTCPKKSWWKEVLGQPSGFALLGLS